MKRLISLISPCLVQQKNIFKPLLIICILSMTPLFANAQAVSVNFDDKVIWADSLNMPESTIAEYIIGMLPELLERPGDFLVNDYTVKVDDMPVGSAVDAVLTQIRLCDIEKITVSESPLSSYENNSKSGSINIVLKQRATEKKPYWGSVSADLALPCDIWPNLSFGYKKNKFMVRAIALGEFYKASYDTDYLSYNPNGELIKTISANSKDKFWANLSTLFMNYDASPKDKLALNVSFLKGNDNTDANITGDVTQLNKLYINNTDLRSFFKYDHQFTATNELHFEFQHIHHPAKNDFSEGADFINMENKAEDISGQLKMKFSLLSPKSKYKSFLFVGTNGNVSITNTSSDHFETADGRHMSNDKMRSRGLTPFVESENYFGQFRLKLQANYQYYHYDFRREGLDRIEKDNTDFAGKMMFEWHFRQKQLLRFIGEQQVKMPSEMQIYPYIIEDVSTNLHVKGNLDLKNIHSNNFTVDYIYSNNWGASSLTMNVSGSYNHISNVISCNYKNMDDGRQYLAYENVGDNNMFVGMVMAMYKYKRLSLTLTADYYNNSMIFDTYNDHYRYFDIVLMPTFRTSNNWTGSMRLIYNSPVDTEYLHYGGIGAISFQLGKSWGDFNVHAYGGLSLGGRTTDIIYEKGGNYTKTISQVMKNSIGIGLRYSF